MAADCVVGRGRTSAPQSQTWSLSEELWPSDARGRALELERTAVRRGPPYVPFCD